MQRPHLPFVDWMKTVGLGLIVFGHVGHNLIAWATPPFYPKQLGVAFFVFITGYTLARERRPSVQVVVRRWFDVWAYGLIFAALMTVIGLGVLGDGNPSDYLPLAGGFNVLFDNFPANPTTWYIGTYLHLLLLWAFVLRGRPVSRVDLLVAAGVEIAVRALLIPSLGPFVAYQALFNWLGVLLLGLLFGQQDAKPKGRDILPAAGLIVIWPLLVGGTLAWTPTFPFMTSTLVAAPWNAWVLSVTVTVAYLGYAIAGFTLLGSLPESRVARFFARNTLVVFIAHMPLYHALNSVLAPMPYVPRVVTMFAICFGGLALLSEAIRPALQPALHAARNRLLLRISLFRAA
jgi:fucose 4-O-acetylase-like acetyltransferase